MKDFNDVYNLIDTDNFIIATVATAVVVIATCLYFFVSKQTKKDDQATIKDDESVSENETEKSDDVIINDDEMKAFMENPNTVKKYVRIMRNQTTLPQELDPIHKEEEESMKAKQLAQICALMKQKEDVFGEMTMEDIQNQMSLYC